MVKEKKITDKEIFKERQKGRIVSRRVFKKEPAQTIKVKAPPQVEFRSQSFKNNYNQEKRNLLSWK